MFFRRKKAAERVLTVSFVNMDGYVGIAERIALEHLWGYVNRYLGQQRRIICASGGRIDSGGSPDEVMGYWGLDGDEAAGAQHACRAALHQLQAMERFSKWAEENGLPRATARIGVCTGRLVVGNISPKPGEGVALFGSAIAAAACFASAAKNVESRILVGESTHALVSDLRFGDAMQVEVLGSASTAYPLLGVNGLERRPNQSLHADVADRR